MENGEVYQRQFTYILFFISENFHLSTLSEKDVRATEGVWVTHTNCHVESVDYRCFQYAN